LIKEKRSHESKDVGESGAGPLMWGMDVRQLNFSNDKASVSFFGTFDNN
jgi:hypothetical protein